MITDTKFYFDYLKWGDSLLISAIRKLSNEKYRHSFGELAGSIGSKVGHLVGIYDFFVKAIEANPVNEFPNYEHLSIIQISQKWELLIERLEYLINTEKYRVIELPLALGKYVNIEFIYLDIIFHTIHHRGQILSFIRSQNVGKDVVHPRDVNLDFLNYLFREQPQLIYELNHNTPKQIISDR